MPRVPVTQPLLFSLLAFWLLFSSGTSPAALTKQKHLAPPPAASLIPFKLAALESFSVVDSQAVERRRSGYESALFYALGENAKRLEACGYKFQLALSYFDVADRFAPREKAAQLEKNGAWFIIGPGASDRYLMSVLGTQSTPVVSPAASSNASHALVPPFFTMYPSADKFAGALLKATRQEGYGKRYGTVLDITCTICKDFSASFDEQAKTGKLDKRFHIEVAGDRPDLGALIGTLQSENVDFLVLPNYGRLAGYIIHELQSKFPELRYAGSHSWGDGLYSSVLEFTLLPSVRGVSVISGLNPAEMEKSYSVHSLQRESGGEALPLQASSFYLIDAVRTLTHDLCEHHKKTGQRLLTKEAVYEFYRTRPKRHFRGRENLSFYRLGNSTMTFGGVVQP